MRSSGHCSTTTSVLLRKRTCPRYGNSSAGPASSLRSSPSVVTPVVQRTFNRSSWSASGPPRLLASRVEPCGATSSTPGRGTARWGWPGRHGTASRRHAAWPRGLNRFVGGDRPGTTPPPLRGPAPGQDPPHGLPDRPLPRQRPELSLTEHDAVSSRSERLVRGNRPVPRRDRLGLGHRREAGGLL